MTIETIHGKSILIDADAYNLVSGIRWRINTWGYVHGSIKIGTKWVDIVLHRLIMNAPKGVEVDHINSDKLDNRKENLRFCDRKQNKANTRLLSTNTSGYKGVSLHKEKWQASIRFNGKLLYLGRYDTKEGAAEAYNKKAKELWGEFAWLNPKPKDLGQ